MLFNCLSRGNRCPYCLILEFKLQRVMDIKAYSKPVVLFSKLLKAVYLVLFFFIILYGYGNFQGFLDMTQNNLLKVVAGISLACFLLSACLFFLLLFSIFRSINTGIVLRTIFTFVSLVVSAFVTVLASGIVVFASGSVGV